MNEYQNESATIPSLKCSQSGRHWSEGSNVVVTDAKQTVTPVRPGLAPKARPLILGDPNKSRRAEF